MPIRRQFYLNKLFGGARNAQRVEVMPGASSLIVPTASRKDFMFYAGTGFPPHNTMTFKNIVYTRREFGGPQGTVVFYAENALSNAEACDRLWRFLMRAAGSRELQP